MIVISVADFLDPLAFFALTLAFTWLSGFWVVDTSTISTSTVLIFFKTFLAGLVIFPAFLASLKSFLVG